MAEGAHLGDIEGATVIFGVGSDGFRTKILNGIDVPCSLFTSPTSGQLAEKMDSPGEGTLSARVSI